MPLLAKKLNGIDQFNQSSRLHHSPLYSSILESSTPFLSYIHILVPVSFEMRPFQESTLLPLIALEEQYLNPEVVSASTHNMPA
jgi:hypothetical protein